MSNLDRSLTVIDINSKTYQIKALWGEKKNLLGTVKLKFVIQLWCQSCYAASKLQNNKGESKMIETLERIP